LHTPKKFAIGGWKMKINHCNSWDFQWQTNMGM
jgi:hypothetical protein